MSAYTRENGIINTPKWKWTRHLTKNPNKYIIMYKIFSDHTKRKTIKYNYGFKVTQYFYTAIKFYVKDVNTLWWYEIGIEMAYIYILRNSR